MPYPSLWGVLVGYSPLGKVLSWKNQCPKMKTPGGEATGLPGEKPLWSADGEVGGGRRERRTLDSQTGKSANGASLPWVRKAGNMGLF